MTEEVFTKVRFCLSLLTMSEINQPASQILPYQDSLSVESIEETKKEKTKIDLSSSRPTNLQFFAQGQHDFFRNMAGVPEGARYSGLIDEGGGVYSLSAGGLTTGWMQSPTLSFGLDWRRWDVRVKEKNGEIVPMPGNYKQVGPRITFDASFGNYHFTHYDQKLTLSSEQLQELTQDAMDETSESLFDVYMTGDTTDLLTLDDAIKILIQGYDPSEDANLENVQHFVERRTYRVGGTLWMAGSSVYNTNTPVNLFESAHMGIGTYFAGWQDNHFFGFGPKAEIVPLRASVGPARAEVFFDVGATYYQRYDPELLFETGFWQSGQFFIEANSGVGLRITMNAPKTKDVVRVSQKAVENYLNNPPDFDPEDLDF